MDSSFCLFSWRISQGPNFTIRARIFLAFHHFWWEGSRFLFYTLESWYQNYLHSMPLMTEENFHQEKWDFLFDLINSIALNLPTNQPTNQPTDRRTDLPTYLYLIRWFQMTCSRIMYMGNTIIHSLNIFSVEHILRSLFDQILRTQEQILKNHKNHSSAPPCVTIRKNLHPIYHHWRNNAKSIYSYHKPTHYTHSKNLISKTAPSKE